jgi:hypothetical protein
LTSFRFIAGMSRAGTTSLASTLNRHGDVIAFGETGFWGNHWVTPGRHGYSRTHIDSLIARYRCMPYTPRIAVDEGGLARISHE